VIRGLVGWPFSLKPCGSYQISSGGGRTPVWAANEHDLYFVNRTSIMAIDHAGPFDRHVPQDLAEKRTPILPRKPDLPSRGPMTFGVVMSIASPSRTSLA